MKTRAVMTLAAAAFGAASAPAVGSAAITSPPAALAAATPPAAVAEKKFPSPGLEDICRLPPPLQGVRGHLLFEYTVDAAGKTRDVLPLYARVEPEKDRQALIAALADCVRDWAYQGGSATTSKKEGSRLVPFHFFGPAPAHGPLIELPDGRQLPAGWFDEMREEKLKLADSLLGQSQYKLLDAPTSREFRGPGWMLRTNVGTMEAQAMQDALERARRAFEAAFPAAPPAPEEAGLTVLYFQQRREFEQVNAFDNLIFRAPNLAGRYSTHDRLIIAAIGEFPLGLAARVMTHEATHHFVSQRLYRGGKVPPTWLNEGIASLVECMGFGGEGEIDLAALDRGKIIQVPALWSKAVEEFLKVLSDASLTGKMPHLADLLSGRLDAEFRGSDAKRYYAMSWLLVHYLFNAEAGKHRERFRTWVGGSPGNADGETLAAAIGRPLVEIEAELPVYLESVKAPGGAWTAPAEGAPPK